MSRRAVPPASAVRLLERVLPPGVRGRSMIGDLLEEWHGRAPGARRTAWFWTETLRLAARYGLAPGAGARSRGRPGGASRIPCGGVLEDLRHAARRVVRSPGWRDVDHVRLGSVGRFVDRRNPTIYVVVAGVLALTGTAASLTPLRRALSVDVTEVLRAD